MTALVWPCVGCRGECSSNPQALNLRLGGFGRFTGAAGTRVPHCGAVCSQRGTGGHLAYPAHAGLQGFGAPRGRGLIEAIRQEEGEAGPPRTLYRATPTGQEAAFGWLHTPVTRLRHGRSDLRLKIAFLLRLKHDLEPLLKAQEGVFEAILEDLQQRFQTAKRIQLVAILWRMEMAKASLGFIQQLLARREDLSK